MRRWLGLVLLGLAAAASSQEIRIGVPDPEVRFHDAGLTLLVSQIGYASPGERTAYLFATSRALGDAVATFTVEDTARATTVLTATPQYAGTWLEQEFYRLDLSPVTAPGTYRIRAATLVSHRFPIASPRELYFDGDARRMTVEQLAVRIRRDAIGGYVDSGNDIRETNSHAVMVLGLLELLERHGVWLAPADAATLQSDVAHFRDFLVAQQDPASGRITGGFFWTTPILDGEWPNHFRGMTALVALAHEARPADPALADALLDRTRLAASYARTRLDPATAHSVFLLDALEAESHLYLEAGDAPALAATRTLAGELRSRQITLAEAGPDGLYGLFRETRGSSTLTRLNHHDFGAMTGAYVALPMTGLAALLAENPPDPDALLWRALLTDYTLGFLKRASTSGPMALLPNGTYAGGLHWFSDLFHGMSMTYALAAAAMIRYGEVLHDPSLYALAERQLLWIGGLNTGAGFPAAAEPFSCLTGRGYQWLFDGHGVLTGVPGAIVNGLSATPQFVKQLPPGPEQPEYLCDESWITHTGAWLAATTALIRARLDLGNSLRVVKAEPGQMTLSWQEVRDGVGYRAYRDVSATGRFDTLVGTAGPTSSLKAPLPLENLVFLRMSASSSAGPGPK